MSYECTHMLLGSIEHTLNRMSPLRDEPGREMREHMLEVHVFCFSNTQVWGEHRLNGRQQKWGEKNERHRRLLPWQMMRLYSTPAPLKVHFFTLFGGMTQRSLHITEWIAKSWKRFSLVCDVDKCSMRSLGHIGNSMQVNLWYSLCWKWTKLIQFTQSLTSQCQNQRKRIKCTFSVTDSKLS